MNPKNQPRQYALLKFDLGDLDPDWWAKYPFEPSGVYVYLGEILNMPGHCVVADYKTGNLLSGYHIDNFVEIPEDEA